MFAKEVYMLQGLFGGPRNARPLLLMMRLVV